MAKICYTVSKKLLLIFGILWNVFICNGFAFDGDEVRPLAEIEKELKVWGNDILTHDSIEYKIALNERFIQRLKTVLKRSDSYDYPFDSLVTVSRLRPSDNSFRIFTWQIVDPNKNCRYFGLVQRKHYFGKNQHRIIVIELRDNVDNNRTLEASALTNGEWFGAIYYKPKYDDYGVLTYTGTFFRQKALTPGLKKEKVKFYVLLGWNGHDDATQYKVIDVILFPKADSSKVNFGAPIFYLGSGIPKHRVVFEYSDNANFSCNQALIDNGKLKKKKLAIVFDHLAKSNKTRSTSNTWDYGADGSYDAIRFVNRYHDQRKGFFVFKKNINVYDPSLKKYNPKVIQKQYEEEAKRLRQYNLDKKKNSQKPNSEKNPTNQPK